MTMHIKALLISASVICVSATTVWAETMQEKGRRIASLVSADEPGFRDQSVSGEMILQSKSGKKSTRRFDASSVDTGNHNTRSLLVFRWPGDIRNTALLTHTKPKGQKDDQWLYLPAVSKIRRISSSGRSGSFVGSEFAYEDMVDQDVEKYTYNWLSEGPCPTSGTCNVIDRFPKSNSAYSSQRMWISSETNRIQQVQYFDRRKALLKTMSMTGYQKHKGRYWRAGRMVMSNHLTGKKTTLTWKNFKFNSGLKANDFTVNSLRRLN